MDHERAGTIKAAEKYVLGEFSEAERDEFEQHFFSCPVCAEQVRATAIFVDNAVAVMRVAPARQLAPAARPSGWTGWFFRPQFGWAAAGLLLAVTTFQFMRIRGLEGRLAGALGPQAVLSTTLLPATRSEPNTIALRRGAAFFEIVLDLDPEQQASQYAYSIQTASGAPVATGTAPAPPPGAGLHLLLPAASFGNGTYAVRVEPAGASTTNAQVQQYQFTLQVQ